MRKIYSHFAALSFCLISNIVWGATDGEQCKNIKIAETSWADNQAANGVLAALAESLGYATNRKLVSSSIALSSMQRGFIDTFLGYWSPALDPSVKPLLEKGKLYQFPVPNLAGAKYTLAVPTYLADQGLRSFQDISKFKDALGSRIYGIESGTGGNKLIAGMIESNKFGLSDFKLVESSEAGMRLEVARAISKKKPIVFLGWAPHPMNIDFKMTYLTGGDEVFGADYGAASVYTLTAPDYAQRCPNAARLVGNLRFTPEVESELMVGILNKEDPVQLATTWIKANPQWLKTWLDGVTTLDGSDATAAAVKHFGL